jgi:signal transduction histidine kinase/ActR/RegA family two-component response regulator
VAAAQRAIAAEMADAESDRAALLETAVAERTSELRASNERLREESETRARAEAQLAQAQKMEAVGQLTGGIAHDFNNMLAVVVGGIDLARRKLAHRPAEVGSHLDGAMEGAARAAALTRRLLSFARAEPLLPDAVLPARLVAGMNLLLDRTLGERITVHIDVANAHWPIWADPHQLENAILNLAVNARDAMEGAGRLDIAVTDLTIGAEDPAGLAPGEYARISVVDSGCGMPPAVLERAFEPFFTTKPVGKGTGLGLSQIFGFVRQSHGDVRVESTVGVGTTISLYLPRQLGAARSQPAPECVPAPGPGGGPLSILLVEDDPRVQASTRAGLTELGHHVRVCASGTEALTLLADNSEYDLMLTDVMMPGMTGPELVAIVARDYPHITALFVTGYVGEAGQSDDFAGYEVLRKPFTISALGNAVGKAINRKGEPPSESEAA